MDQPTHIDFLLAQIEDERHIEIIEKLDKIRDHLNRGLITRNEYLETLADKLGQYVEPYLDALEEQD
jgi:hypothetical protein